MAESGAPLTGDGERLVEQSLRFVGVLRQLGLTVGSGQAQDAARALALVDLTRRDDVYAALRAVLLDAHTHEPVFAIAFDRFWSGLQIMVDQSNAAPLGYAPRRDGRARGGESSTATARKRTVLMSGAENATEGDADTGDESAGEAVAYSAAETLRHKDFTHLTPRELAEMRRLLADLAFSPPLRRLRRS